MLKKSHGRLHSLLVDTYLTQTKNAPIMRLTKSVGFAVEPYFLFLSHSQALPR